MPNADLAIFFLLKLSRGLQIICISTPPQTLLGELMAHNKPTRRRKQTVATTVAVWGFKTRVYLLWHFQRNHWLPVLRSLIQEEVLLWRKTNHRWCFFCFFLSVIHFNRRPSVVCRWLFFLIPLRHPECITVSLLLNWQELCVFSWYCVALQFGGFSTISSVQARMAVCVH